MPSDAVRKVLFLDVDGVLNNGSWTSEMYENGVRVYEEHILEDRALRLLRAIIVETGARIVVSSSWRHEKGAYDKLCEALLRHGMYPLDKTPGPDTDRGRDIALWLEAHPDTEYYAILDDEDDLGALAEHHVRTDPDKGLTETEAYRCVSLLGGRLKVPAFMEDGPVPQGYFDPPNPCADPPKSPYNISAMARYAKSHGKTVADLSREEVKQFMTEEPGKSLAPEKHTGKTAIYIRTVNRTREKPESSPWRLPETISAEVQIGMLTSYARGHGYEDLIFYLDDGYDGSGILEPANMALHREVMAGRISTVIISALHQISGEMNVLMMTEETFRGHGARLVIASYNQDARDVIRQNYNAWLWEGIREGEEDIAAGKCMPAEEAFRRIREEAEEQGKLSARDIENAKPVEPKYTKDGYRLIDAREALWLLKTEYGGQDEK